VVLEFVKTDTGITKAVTVPLAPYVNKKENPKRVFFLYFQRQPEGLWNTRESKRLNNWRRKRNEKF
jgi:hypothetical protein